jgi:hypothetical protein
MSVGGTYNFGVKIDNTSFLYSLIYGGFFRLFVVDFVVHTSYRVKGGLHVSVSVYKSPYDSVHNVRFRARFAYKVFKVLIILLTPITTACQHISEKIG